MFDIGFSELIVIGLVALVVIGPERLPRVARTVGHLLGRLQRYVSDVTSDIQREMQLEDLRKLQQQVAGSARQLESSVRNQIGAVESDIGKTAAAATAALAMGAAAPTAPPAAEGAAQASPEAALDAHLKQADALAGPPAFPESVESAPAEATPSPQLELGLELPPPKAMDKPA
jgi:sec-independent protein translocase protein TatB